ncbi:hypothetical protein [Hymenobacter terrigena]
MAKFVGTIEEFKRYMGPFVRNLVQSVSKPWKMEANNQCEGVPEEPCEFRGEQQLEAAHVSTLSRAQIVEEVFNLLAKNGCLDLFEAEQELRRRHSRHSVLLLCKSCHDKYDGRMIRN